MTADTAKVQADRRAVSSSQTALSGADEALAAAQSSAAIYGQTSVYTALPTVGRVIRLGETLFAIGGQPVVLLYGRETPWRAFASGMSSGGDVWSLNENLRALGYGQPEGSCVHRRDGRGDQVVPGGARSAGDGPAAAGVGGVRARTGPSHVRDARRWERRCRRGRCSA